MDNVQIIDYKSFHISPRFSVANVMYWDFHWSMKTGLINVLNSHSIYHTLYIYDNINTTQILTRILSGLTSELEVSLWCLDSQRSLFYVIIFTKLEMDPHWGSDGGGVSGKTNANINAPHGPCAKGSGGGGGVHWSGASGNVYHWSGGSNNSNDMSV
jgi:hypothetical protein